LCLLIGVRGGAFLLNGRVFKRLNYGKVLDEHLAYLDWSWEIKCTTIASGANSLANNERLCTVECCSYRIAE
jgi:hypothetical protein